VRVALASDERDWHARALLAAFARAGARAVPMRLADCAFDSTAPHGLALPGLDFALPDTMLVRNFGGGSFEEVTRRLGVLHALRELGVPVWNDARAIERCVDKSTTTFLAARAGLPVPQTWAVEGVEQARAIVAGHGGGGLVLKPLFGAQGRGLRRIESPDDLPAASELGGVYYLQRYLPPGGEGFCDHRLFVVAGDVVAAMTRRGRSWITNIRRGGRAEALAPDAEMRDMAARATACVGAHYAGVDLIRDREGKLFLLEVNSMPGWRGLQEVTQRRLADTIVASLLASLR